MIDPFSPLFQAHAPVAGDIVAGVADPASAQGVMIVGIIILVATACWVAGGLGAAVWTRLSDRRERRLQSALRGAGSPSAR